MIHISSTWPAVSHLACRGLHAAAKLVGMTGTAA